MTINYRSSGTVIAVALTTSLFTGAALAAQNDDIKVQLERPAAGEPTTGVGIIQGWALAPAGIDRVELYIDEDPDGTPKQVLAYGGSRADVCARFSGASYPDCSPTRPGFASAFNFNLLNDGRHEFTVRAFDDNGDHNDASVSFRTNDLGEEFIGDASRISLPAFQVSGLRKSNSSSGDQAFDLEFEWSTAEQRFVMTSVTEVTALPFILPAAPTNLSASKSSGNVELTWTDPTAQGAPGDEEWFVIERKFERFAIGADFEVIAVVRNGTTSFTDDNVVLSTTLTPGTYTYRVKTALPWTTEVSSTVTVNQESSLVGLND